MVANRYVTASLRHVGDNRLVSPKCIGGLAPACLDTKAGATLGLSLRFLTFYITYSKSPYSSSDLASFVTVHKAPSRCAEMRKTLTEVKQMLRLRSRKRYSEHLIQDLEYSSYTKHNDLIRVLELQPGTRQDVDCTIRTVSLNSGEPYEALSYVWGDSEKTEQIHIAGRGIVSVTPGLHDALVRLRHPSRPRTMWIDQLCIDQDNAREKTHQVNLMREIYKKCIQCLIWFGELPKDITKNDARGALDVIAVYAGKFDSSEQRAKLPSSLSTLGKLKNACRAFQLFVQNDWWTRIWTVQEAVLPPELTAHWGPLSIPWSVVVTAASNLNSTSFVALPASLRTIDTSNFTPMVRGLAIVKAGESPLFLLQRWRYRNASDPRDKVYALMGLLKLGSLPRILSCDYDLNTASLFAKITCDFIVQEQGLRPLVGLRPVRDPDMPSWAIDLGRHSNVSGSYAWWDHCFRYRWFSACGAEKFQGRLLNQGTTLALRGVMIARVEKVGITTICPEVMDAAYEQLSHQIHSWTDLLLDYLQMNPTLTVYHNGLSYQTAFWRTLVGDLVTDEFPLRRATREDVALVSQFHGTHGWTEIRPSLRCMVLNHAFFITEEGYIGIGPPDMRESDEVWVLAGGRMPFVLRHEHERTLEEGTADRSCERVLVGDAYVHGLMDGEAEQCLRDAQQDVHLV